MSDSYQACDEAQLIRLIQVGGPAEAEHAFHTLYEANNPELRRRLMYRGLHDFEIDDVCSQVWERALDRIEHYVPRGIPYFVWLKRTADNVTKELYRQEKQDLKHTRPITDAVVAPDVLADPLVSLLDLEHEEELEQRRQELKEIMGWVIEQLPPDYRDVILARHEMELSPKDAAEVLGWEHRKVYDTYYRAMRRLRVKLLEEYGITDGGWSGRQENVHRSN